MSTFDFVEVRCAVCGATERFRVIRSTNAFGSADLDLRPPEMQRSTMPLWVQQCPACGYAADAISDETSVTREWLQSEAYQTCDGIAFSSDLAITFYRQHMICLQENDERKAHYALLHAAWACDDAFDAENAAICRKRAIPPLEAMIRSANDEEKDTMLMVKADLLRRSGQFDRLIDEYADVKMKDKLLSMLLAFQLQKAREKDAACYRVSEAVA